MTDRRFIEESFPVKEVGETSGKEKNIRQGNISTLHMWWARRPLAASRATAYAALTSAPEDIEEWQRKRDFIIQLCQWENSNNQQLLEKARQDILEANGGVPPKVLDPFAGGGSYPLEALRLGCEAYACDYNPIAVLIEKATLEYPQKFGRPFEGMPVFQHHDPNSRKHKVQASFFDNDRSVSPISYNPLLEEVRYWGEWVLEEARKELAQFYPLDPDGSIPVGYIWARTIPCQNPACGMEIPLMRQFWLAKKDRKKVALYPNISNGKLQLRIVGDGYEPWPEGFDAEKGTVARAVATCPLCGAMVDEHTTRRIFQEKQAGQQMMVVISASRNGEGKVYRVATKSDKQIFQQAEAGLQGMREKLMLEWGIDPVPDEPLVRVPVAFGVINLWVYGMNDWGSIYNPRQILALITLTDKTRQSFQKLVFENNHPGFSLAVCTYLGLTLSRLTNRMSSLAYWFIPGEKIQPAFVRQALGMVWDYVELNPFNISSGGWKVNLLDEVNVISNLSQISTPAVTAQAANAAEAKRQGG